MPKSRKKAVFVEHRKYLGEILRTLEGHLMPGHVLHAAQAFGVSNRWIHQRQERSPDRPQFPMEEEKFRYYVQQLERTKQPREHAIQAQEREDQRPEQPSLFE